MRGSSSMTRMRLISILRVGLNVAVRYRCPLTSGHQEERRFTAKSRNDKEVTNWCRRTHRGLCPPTSLHFIGPKSQPPQDLLAREAIRWGLGPTVRDDRLRVRGRDTA